MTNIFGLGAKTNIGRRQSPHPFSLIASGGIRIFFFFFFFFVGGMQNAFLRGKNVFKCRKWPILAIFFF